jgi:hypothetical protein
MTYPGFLVMQYKESGEKKNSAGKMASESRFPRGWFFAAVLSACFFFYSPAANAQDCGTPVLTGHFNSSPCNLAQPTPPPGSQFATYLQNWWNGGFLMYLQKMTQQIYSYRVWQTWELGRMMDAQDINRDARIEQEKRLAAQQGVLPSDQVCIAGSSTQDQTRTAVTAAALTQGFKQDLLRRAHNAVEQPVNGSYTPPGITPASDIKARWSEFCQEFYDPNSNDGQGACNTSSAGPVANDDVNVESFLLRDTIDMNNPDEYKAAEAILINIIQPEIAETITPAVLNSPQGEEYTLRLQHLEAIRNIAADVVGSVISRRAPSPQGDSNLAGQVSAIRAKAGVPACPSSPKTAVGPCFSNTPSYNEIMLALTKERFFDPQYFASMQTNPGAVQQEQDAIDGYTTVQLQDIYKMQEQINALLAARASLKLSTDKSNSAISAAPQ